MAEMLLFQTAKWPNWPLPASPMMTMTMMMPLPLPPPLPAGVVVASAAIGNDECAARAALTFRIRSAARSSQRANEIGKCALASEKKI